MAEEKKTMQTEKIEPEKIRTYVNGDTVFKVGCYFSQNGTDTLRDILERSIRRDAKARMKS